PTHIKWGHFDLYAIGPPQCKYVIILRASLLKIRVDTRISVLHSRVATSICPRSRTLTPVHDGILEDVVFPVEIMGKRIRYRLDGAKVIE
ncbi:hypothetical protein ACJX0J_020889, partial [Zea mays]